MSLNHTCKDYLKYGYGYVSLNHICKDYPKYGYGCVFKSHLKGLS